MEALVKTSSHSISSKQAWLDERRKGIGGADCAAILGISKWKTPLAVYQDKIGETDVVPESAAMFWGTTLEPVIRQRYSDVTGREVLLPKGIIYSKDHPFMLANLDGFTPCNRGVEIKTSRYGAEWGEEGTDEIPFEYLAQVQHYMIVTGFEVFDVPVLIGGQDFRIYEVEADAELQAMIIEKEREFWIRVESENPPDPISLSDVERLYRTAKRDEILVTPQAMIAVEELRNVKAQIVSLEAVQDGLEMLIKSEMGEHDTLCTNDGKVICTWKESKGREYVDNKKLKAERPEIYREYLKSTEASRRFLLKKGEK